MKSISFWAVGSEIALVAVVVGLTVAAHHGVLARLHWKELSGEKKEERGKSGMNEFTSNA